MGGGCGSGQARPADNGGDGGALGVGGQRGREWELRPAELMYRDSKRAVTLETGLGAQVPPTP